MSELNYFKEKRRMIEGLGGLTGDITCGTACKECLLSSCKNEYRLGCLVFEMLHPDEATKIVRKWADEHPRKTRKDILLEKFPNAKVSHTGRARICAYALGLVSEEEYHEKCCEYPTAVCTDCWNTEVEE